MEGTRAVRGLLRAYTHALNIVRRFAKSLEPAMHDVCSLYGRLRVELCRVRDLEEHVLHHVGAVGPLELERTALEEHVVEAPCLGA